MKTLGEKILAKTPGTGLRGRGASDNPANRFEKLQYHSELEEEGEASSLRTTFYEDSSQSLITYNDSPDLGFNASINPYRGCEHGCIYCYARPTHEYLGFSAGLDFETKILVKKNAPALLRKELSAKKWQPQLIAISGVTDCYQPAERHFQLTRRCMEVLAEFRNPVGIVTKNRLVTRDLDILKAMASYDGVMVLISITTLDAKLARIMEPRTSSPSDRLKALEELNGAGVPTAVLIAPIIPALNDFEIPKILQAASQMGTRHASYVLLRLPGAVAPLFQYWLEQHYPERKEKILNRIRAVRGGKLNESAFGKRQRGEGIFAQQVKQLFDTARRKYGFQSAAPKLSVDSFRPLAPAQGNLFSEGIILYQSLKRLAVTQVTRLRPSESRKPRSMGPEVSTEEKLTKFFLLR
jgi:DNA repair photolyase